VASLYINNAMALEQRTSSIITEHVRASSNSSDLYSEGAGIDSRPGHQLS
jgi:hypothetical protein